MKKVVMIAGGGTGGHIYPALAIAQALIKLEPGLQVHFVGTAEGLESKILPREKFPLHLIAGGKLNFPGNYFLKLKTLLKLPLGFFQSIQLLQQYKSSYVIGVGGYASGPFVLAAALMGFKTALWEANVLPGMANRWLSRFVKKYFLVFEETKNAIRSNADVQVLGMPVRAEIENSLVADPSRKEGPFQLLHYGGSQGSRVIGRTLATALLAGGDWMQNLKVVHQTGSIDFTDFKQRYSGLKDIVELREFIFNMPDYYKKTDLVVCRGGASTLNELAAFGLPAVVIPLPAADGHQEKNAQMMADKGAVRMILQKDLTAEKLAEEIGDLRRNPEKLEKMRSAVRQFHRPRAAEAIAKEILAT
jgi:UDP-N-acetylglucosamine--N-acetylmuramyl-(pentapeptide) pyrophosphoryl-undecaprenol N-acetylglucosamine transferase